MFNFQNHQMNKYFSFLEISNLWLFVQIPGSNVLFTNSLLSNLSRLLKFKHTEFFTSHGGCLLIVTL